MPEEDTQFGEYITLKEAAKISGYSADYIGQLIRKGKIRGRQVYTNIAWVTTKEDLRAYLNGERISEESESNTITRSVGPWAVANFTPRTFLILRIVFIFIAVISLGVSLFLLYVIFSASDAHAYASLQEISHFSNIVHASRRL
jgi:hypothetical protein